MRKLLALAALALVGCDHPSSRSVAAYREAQKAALARVDEQQAALSKSVGEIREGKWVPRRDLGACVSSLPPPPDPKDPGVYPAWVLDDPVADGVAGWNHLGERVFKQLRESIGDPNSEFMPDTEKETLAKTARIGALDPRDEKDFAILFVDELHRPTQTDEKTFAGGDERGRVWVWNPKARTVICAGTFESTTPHEVLVKFYHEDNRPMQVSSDLMLSLRKNSIHSAIGGLIAAGSGI
jgi:hypothetical protein